MTVAVDKEFLDRWYFRTQVTGAKPQLFARIRRGQFVRSFRVWDEEDNDDFGQILGRSNGLQWIADWTPLEPWSQLLGVTDCRVEQSFDNQGIASAQMTMDNYAILPKVGVTGNKYYEIAGGYYSPYRGYAHPGRPAPRDEKNEWYSRLIYKTQVEVYMGYGDRMYPVWTGLTDKTGLTVKPHKINITARDFGQMLIEQNMYGLAIDPDLSAPVIFVPRGGKGEKGLDEVEKVTGAVRASSTDDASGHKPRHVLDTNGSSYWLSNIHNGPNVTEWIQMHLPSGRYGSFYVLPYYPDMEVFVGLYLRPPGVTDYKHAYFDPRGTTDRFPISEVDMQVDGYKDKKKTEGRVPYGWWNPHHQGPDDRVPGQHGGWAYFKHYPSLPAQGKVIDIGGDITFGKDTVLRIGFRHLGRIRRKGADGYAAAVARMYGVRRKQKSAQQIAAQSGAPTAGKGTGGKHIVLVDDASDIVRTLCRWAGFKPPWDIQNVGVNLKHQYSVAYDKSFRDVIQEVQDNTGFVFFIAEPTTATPLGVPTFRPPVLTRNANQSKFNLDSENLLEGLDTEYSDEPLRARIEIWGQRGKASATASKKSSKRNKKTNTDRHPARHPLAGKTSKANNRVYATYLPPWRKRLAGQKKYFVHLAEKMETTEDCQVMCYILAMQMALASYTGTFSCSFNPGIGLDELVGIDDRPTATNSRVYVSNRVMTYKSENGDTELKMEFGGSLVDTPDVLRVAQDYFIYVANLAKAPKTNSKAKTGNNVTKKGKNGDNSTKVHPPTHPPHH